MCFRIEPTFEGTLSFPLTFRAEVNLNVFTPMCQYVGYPETGAGGLQDEHVSVS
jgi:hypothetical protein